MAPDISANGKNKCRNISSIFYENLNLLLLTGAVSRNDPEKHLLHDAIKKNKCLTIQD